jgi:hypothetical protein
MPICRERRGGFIETGKAEDEDARKLKLMTTKPCPKCGVRIEKNGGCIHMTCRREIGGCSYEVDCIGGSRADVL